MSDLTPLPVTGGFARDSVPPPSAIQRLAPWAIVALVLVRAGHLALTHFGEPRGSVLDGLLVASATPLKLAAWLGLVVLIGQVHATLFGKGAAALRAFAALATLPSLLIVALALAREHWAPWLSNDSVKYYFDGDQVFGSNVLAHRAAWSHHWAKGHVVLAEVVLVIVFAAIHAFVGWRCGVRRVWSALFATVLCEVALAGYLVKAPWSLLDHDLFHGDVVSSALLFDQLSMVASDPYSTLASAFYLAVACACMTLLSLREPR